MSKRANDKQARGREVRAKLNAVRRKATGYQDMQRLMNRYAVERFLFRLGRSPHADKFILKGAMLLVVYLPDAARSTRDADFLGFGQFTPQSLKGILAEVCADEQDDGLVFVPSAIIVEAAGADREYPGYTVTIPARLGDANCNIRLDIGFGEAVEPPAKRIDYPTILPMPKPRIRAYALDTMIAEKFQAMARLGMSNSRMKDYHDLSEIALHCTLDGLTLRAAMVSTFTRRRTPVPADRPIGLTEAFHTAKNKQKSWAGFLTRQGLPRRLQLADACANIERLVMPVARAIVNEEDFLLTWRDNAWQ